MNKMLSVCAAAILMLGVTSAAMAQAPKPAKTKMAGKMKMAPKKAAGKMAGKMKMAPKKAAGKMAPKKS